MEREADRLGQDRVQDGGGGSPSYRARSSPHTLRHTAATWLMQSGVSMWRAAGFLGMSVETLDRVYGHHHPDYFVRRGGARSAVNQTGTKRWSFHWPRRRAKAKKLNEYMVGPGGTRTSNQTVMSGGIRVAAVDFPAHLAEVERVCSVSLRSFLVRNWCGNRQARDYCTADTAADNKFKSRSRNTRWLRNVKGDPSRSLSLSEIKSGCIDGANLRGVGWARYGQRAAQHVTLVHPCSAIGACEHHCNIFGTIQAGGEDAARRRQRHGQDNPVGSNR